MGGVVKAISNVVSYADEPKIESTFQTDEYGGISHEFERKA